MIYHTMTRNRVMRMKAKGWLMTGQLINDLYYGTFDYYEITIDRQLSLLRGHGYNPNEDTDDTGIGDIGYP